MATVVNTYARAFADVVIGIRLDASRTLSEAQQISQLPGVAQVAVYGAQKFAIRVQVDPVAVHAQLDRIQLADARIVFDEKDLALSLSHRGERIQPDRKAV